MNTPVIRPRLCSAYILVLSECISLRIHLPADPPASSASSRMTVQQYFKLKPASVGLSRYTAAFLIVLAFSRLEFLTRFP